MYGVAIRLGLVATAAVLAGCAARRDDDLQPVSNDPQFTPDTNDDPPTTTNDTGDPITSQAYSDVQSTYDADLDGYLTEENATQLNQAIDDGYVEIDQTAEAALALIEQGKYDCNDSPLTGFYTFPAAQQRLTMNQINDCDATDIEVELGEDAMSLSIGSATLTYADGDITGDGISDKIVAGGHLYIYANPAEDFGPGKFFNPEDADLVVEADTTGGDYFGFAYPQIKDLNGDGTNDLVFRSSHSSDGSLVLVPGPINSSKSYTRNFLQDATQVSAANVSVINVDNGGAFFLTADMDGYEPEVGEVVMWTGVGGIDVYPALFEPGIHETEPFYTFEGPLYDELSTIDPVAGDVDGYEEDGATFVDLLVGDVNYNRAVLIRGGTWLQNYIGQTIEVDNPDEAAYHQEGNIHLEETTIPFNRFSGNIDEGAYFAGASLGMGDVDGDGLADFSVGVLREDANGYDNAGCGYLIFAEGYNNGPFSSGESIVLNGDVFSIGGVATCGVEENMGVPGSLSIASDLNGDGFKDSVLSALSGGTTGKNFAQDAWTLIDNAENRIRVDTAEHEILGPTGVRVGDIDFDNDGFEDVVVNDAYSDTDYILFGGPSE